MYFQNTNAEQLFLGDQIIGKSQLHIVQSVLDRLKNNIAKFGDFVFLPFLASLPGAKTVSMLTVRAMEAITARVTPPNMQRFFREGVISHLLFSWSWNETFCAI